MYILRALEHVQIFNVYGNFVGSPSTLADVPFAASDLILLNILSKQFIYRLSHIHIPQQQTMTRLKTHLRPPVELELSVKLSLQSRLGGEISYFILKNEEKRWEPVAAERSALFYCNFFATGITPTHLRLTTIFYPEYQ